MQVHQVNLFFFKVPFILQKCTNIWKVNHTEKYKITKMTKNHMEIGFYKKHFCTKNCESIRTTAARHRRSYTFRQTKQLYCTFCQTLIMIFVIR